MSFVIGAAIICIMKLFDSHTHVQFPQFDKDRDAVIQRSFDNGVWMINVGADKETSMKAVELAKNHPEGIYAAVGIHPHSAGKIDLDEELKILAKNPKVVAIGECGLDYYNRQPITNNQQQKNKQEQKDLFLKHIRLAKEVEKPLMIHCRDAFSDLISILKPITFNLKPSIVHFFTGTLDDARKLLEMGFYFTFGGLITYNRQFDAVIELVPLDKILVETDAPFVSPEPYRSQRNEPTLVIEVAKKLAEIKNIPFDAFCERVVANNFKIFNL